VANFEYIDKAESEEEIENNFSVSSSGRQNYWKELLKGRYQKSAVEELDALGKGKRSRTKLLVCHRRESYNFSLLLIVCLLRLYTRFADFLDGFF
jgi:hypothetical protein